MAPHGPLASTSLPFAEHTALCFCLIYLVDILSQIGRFRGGKAASSTGVSLGIAGSRARVHGSCVLEWPSINANGAPCTAKSGTLKDASPAGPPSPSIP